jgi:hypothetical protein
MTQGTCIRTVQRLPRWTGTASLTVVSPAKDRPPICEPCADRKAVHREMESCLQWDPRDHRGMGRRHLTRARWFLNGTWSIFHSCRHGGLNCLRGAKFRKFSGDQLSYSGPTRVFPCPSGAASARTCPSQNLNHLQGKRNTVDLKHTLISRNLQPDFRSRMSTA